MYDTNKVLRVRRKGSTHTGLWSVYAPEEATQEEEIVAESIFELTNPTATSIKIDASKSALGGVEKGNAEGTHAYMIESTRYYLDVLQGGDVVTMQAGANVDFDGVDTFTKNIAGNSWNTWFQSDAVIFDPNIQDGAVSWVVEADTNSDGEDGTQGTVREMGGLDDNPSANSSYSSGEFMIYQVNATTLYVYEKGANKGAFSASISVGDRLGVRIESGVATYFHQSGTFVNDFYVSNSPATSPMYFKGAMNRGVGSTGLSVMGEIVFHNTMVQTPISRRIFGAANQAVADEDVEKMLEVGLSVNTGSVYSLISAERIEDNRFIAGTTHEVVHDYSVSTAQSVGVV